MYNLIRTYIQEIIRYIYILSFGTMLIGAAISTATMSTGQIALASIWLIDMAVNYRRIAERFHSLWKNKAALVCISLFLLYIVGLLWTENYAFAMRDLRSKLPLFLLPFTIAMIKPLNMKELKAVFYLFLAGNLLGTLLVLYAFFFREVTDIRQIIGFNSNIRFGLTVLMAVIVSFWFFKNTATTKKYWFIVLMLWFTGMLLLMESMTALSILPVIVVFFGLRSAWFAPRKIVRWGMLTLVAAASVSIFLYLHHIYADFQPKESKILSELDKTTAHGCEYQHDTTSKQLENGYWVQIYICYPEMRESWNRRSSMDFDGQDLKGYGIKTTLTRYLTGKGLRKDAEGVAALSDDDIRNVERGIANHHNAQKSNIDSRIRTTFWEYYTWKELNYATGASLTQRFEFWRASFYTIRHHFWFGVGTGDMMDAQITAYKEVGSLLPEPEIYKTPHNHYLIVFTTFGVVGFAWFLFALIYPGIKTKQFRSPLYIAFFIVILLSMMVDKLGIGLFAAFNSLLLLGTKKYLSLHKKNNESGTRLHE
ncbi:MAG: O-antigen ligase family protein [Bacteroidales bacterium]|nr:O-antigen ligase family protein [Bacteroidales bacterium]